MVIVITGTHKGIGLKLAQYYLDMGHTVIGCSRHENELCHKNYKHYQVDVSSSDDIDNFAKSVRKEFKIVDVLVNNAGVASMNHFLMTPEDTAKRLMNINYFGSLNCSKAFAPLIRKSSHGRIINFTTVAAPLNLEGEMAYVASKSAIESMTKIMAKELSSFNITVNAIGPTPVKTDLTSKVPEEKLGKLLDSQAIHRFGEFEDIANVIDFYIRPESDFITGQIIYLGGVNR